MQTILRVIGGLAIVVGSFWITNMILDRWDSDPARRNTIEVLDATYGANCTAKAAGNVTQYVAKICGVTFNCSLPIDYSKMGDPAPGCAKDFSLKYRCGQQSESRALAVSPEASGKTLKLECQKP